MEKTEKKTNQNNLIGDLFNLILKASLLYCLPSSITANYQFVTHYTLSVKLNFIVQAR